MRISPLVLLLLETSFLGCQSTSIYSSTKSNTPIEGLTLTTSSPISTAISSEVVAQQVITSCPTVESTPPTGLAGNIVLAHESDADSYLLNLETGLQTALPRPNDGELSDFELSPDRMELAYAVRDSVGIGQQILLVNSNGGVINSIPWGSNWWIIVDWIKTDQMVIDIYDQSLDKLVLIDIGTGETYPLSTDFPNIANLPVDLREWWGWGSAEVVYDPSLSMVVYAKQPEGLADLGTIVIWDPKRNTAIAEIPTNTFFGSTPVWDPSDEEFALNISSSAPAEPVLGAVGLIQELYRINKVGEMEKLTSLGDFYLEARIGQSSWSPDGKMIAFWLQASFDFPVPFDEKRESPSERLAVVDLRTRITTNYCLFGDEVTNYANPPIWSPDGKRVLIENRDLDGVLHSIILDLENAEAFDIAQGYVPEAWMK